MTIQELYDWALDEGCLNDEVVLKGIEHINKINGYYRANGCVILH